MSIPSPPASEPSPLSATLRRAAWKSWRQHRICPQRRCGGLPKAGSAGRRDCDVDQPFLPVGVAQRAGPTGQNDPDGSRHQRGFPRDSRNRWRSTGSAAMAPPRLGDRRDDSQPRHRRGHSAGKPDRRVRAAERGSIRDARCDLARRLLHARWMRNRAGSATTTTSTSRPPEADTPRVGKCTSLTEAGTARIRQRIGSSGAALRS